MPRERAEAEMRRRWLEPKNQKETTSERLARMDAAFDRLVKRARELRAERRSTWSRRPLSLREVAQRLRREGLTCGLLLAPATLLRFLERAAAIPGKRTNAAGAPTEETDTAGAVRFGGIAR